MTPRNQRAAKLKAVALLAFSLSSAALLALLLGSCSPRLGWGLVLWAAPEGPLPAGTIVPVYIKSNIQKVFVVGVPGLKGRAKNKKIELPFWQVELYSAYRAAAARLKALGPNVSLYMKAARDGLPLRDKPSNSAKRVYRLREGQSVKILEKVEGDAVSTGSQVLPGAWYLVLTDDGTKGYSFSYALRLYDETKEGPPVIASAKQALSGRVDLIFSRSWRPEYFQEMLDEGHVDLDYFSPRFGVFSDTVRRQIRIELPAASQVFNYTDISEASGFYLFGGTPLKVKIESDSRIVCYWSGLDPTAPSSQARRRRRRRAAPMSRSRTAPSRATNPRASTGMPPSRCSAPIPSRRYVSRPCAVRSFSLPSSTRSAAPGPARTPGGFRLPRTGASPGSPGKGPRLSSSGRNSAKAEK